MGRVYDEILVNGSDLHTIFDPGNLSTQNNFWGIICMKVEDER